MKSTSVIIIWAVAFLFFSITVFGQDSIVIKPKFKPRIEFYPSLSTMYGLGYYKLLTGYYKRPSLNYYNQTFNLGIFLNADWKIKPEMSIQFYVGYSRWLQANLFPIGLMLKPKLNKKPNELYLKIGGGFTLGRRYDDKNEPWLPSSMPRDYGNGSMHFQAGLEKNLHIKSNKSLSVCFLLSIQFIKSYFSENYQAYGGPLKSYFIPYKFGGFTIAYHFY
jgi:hypothetical protein